MSRGLSTLDRLISLLISSTPKLHQKVQEVIFRSVKGMNRNLLTKDGA